MERRKRKRLSNKNVVPKTKKDKDDACEDITSDSESGSDRTGDKRRRNGLRASTKVDRNYKDESDENGCEDFEPDSDDEAMPFIHKKRSNKVLDVESIISTKQFKGKTKYLIKWTDGSETWETKKRTTKVCPVMLQQFVEEAKRAFEDQVEAIVSHRKKNSRIKYLIKWKDHSKGETWESEIRAKQLCANLVTSYTQEVEITRQKAIEVEAIVGHEWAHGRPKYLIKWKDHSKGDTWETARKTISVCPAILDEYTKDKHDAAPPPHLFGPSWWYKETKDKPKRNRYLFGQKKLSDESDDESDESAQWEVEHIVKHRIKGPDDWEFLIRWKGCTSMDDTWEVEENLNCPDLLANYLAEVADGMRISRPSVKKQLSDEDDSDESDENAEWEVERIVKHRNIGRTKREFLIRWKGCTSKDDTWEVEENLNCRDLLSNYLAEDGMRKSRQSVKKQLSDEDDSDESDENAEWEVERIVKHRNIGKTKREFLIRWKGCTSKDDTWEVEENLNCSDLLSNYLAEVA